MITNQKSKSCVLYCRVSTKEQVEEGNSLQTQERICREYALKNSFEVVKVFVEEGESAKTADRTELKKLLAYCSDKKNNISAIIVYKLDRLSRNTDDYSQLRILLRRYSVEIKSTSEHFEDTPVGRFMENTMANIAQFDNDVRAERCAGGMKEAVREGRYVWMAPVGYRNTTIAGKSTIIQSEQAPLIKEVFETIAKGMHAVEDVRKDMNKRGLVSRVGKPIIRSQFYKMLKCKIYMGYIEKFGECHKGKFEPIVTEEIFEQVQRVLKGRGKKMSQYKKDHEDFPLRRFVMREDGMKLTGSWCQGRSKKYAFYRFSQKGSNYNRDKFEEMFMAEMDKFRYDLEKIGRLKEILKAKFSKVTADEQKQPEKIRARINDLNSRQDALIQKNLAGVISDVVLKQQLDQIDRELCDNQALLSSVQDSEHNFDDLMKIAEEYLQNPSYVWKKANLDKKVKLQWFQFPLGLIFKNEIFGSAEVCSLFKAKEAFQPQMSRFVDPRRFELLTSSLQMRRSTN